eukprot:3429195-Amphidinium_carterae.1
MPRQRHIDTVANGWSSPSVSLDKSLKLVAAVYKTAWKTTVAFVVSASNGVDAGLSSRGRREASDLSRHHASKARPLKIPPQNC